MHVFLLFQAFIAKIYFKKASLGVACIVVIFPSFWIEQYIYIMIVTEGHRLKDL